jgi:uncharacterized protein (TIGR02001 family)
MKSVFLAAVLAMGFAGNAAAAADSAASLSFNAAITSDYRYRAISQTRLQPALQGGADFAHNPSGLYAGAWASTIKWTQDAGGDGGVELDLYAGKRGALAAGLGYDLGVLRYVYPSNGLGKLPGFVNADTTEAYGQLSWGLASLKYSHALTNLFGFADSKNSAYLDLAANLEAGAGLVVNLHAGRQRIENNGAASYADWKIGLTRDFGVFAGSLAWIGTNARESAYASPANGKFLGKSALVLSISKTF